MCEWCGFLKPGITLKNFKTIFILECLFNQNLAILVRFLSYLSHSITGGSIYCTKNTHKIEGTVALTSLYLEASVWS